ncbi:hypothetical protein [Bordetella trematum]|uniref:hypothetical protein n=1 Tax=Bordetella trematum TaxID=123899 RepID=UPI003AF384D3
MNQDSNGKPAGSLPARLAKATIFGLGLFAAGYGIYKTGVFGDLYAMIGGQVTQAVTAPPYSRAEMYADRKAYAKDPTGAAPPRMPVGADGYYIPPAEADLPKGPYGDAVKRGRDIFTQTGVMVKANVGNAMACVNCHIDAGRREHSAPMWGALRRLPRLSEQDRQHQHARRPDPGLLHVLHECAGFTLWPCARSGQRCLPGPHYLHGLAGRWRACRRETPRRPVPESPQTQGWL